MTKQETNVFKIGGNVIDNPGLLTEFVENFTGYQGRKILVHGGGKKLTELSKIMGQKVKMIDGRRVTDANVLELAMMVYGGLINTDLVAKLQAVGCNAIGMTGADGNLLLASKRPEKPIDFGYVGDITSINTILLNQLLGQGLVPVLCALTHDGSGQLLNTNADTIAAEVSAALSADNDVSLVYLFEHAGLLQDLSDPESLITRVDRKSYDLSKQEGIIAEGMIPKMDNAFLALERGVRRVQIGSVPNLKSGLSISTHVHL